MQKQHSTALRPYQPNAPRKRSTPIMHQRYLRPMNAGSITSSFGGKLVPLTAVGLHREDGMRSSTFAINVQMAETANMLLNPVRVTARAFFVPKLAFDRFVDMGTIDRSFNEQTEIDGSTVPWFEPELDPTKEFYNTIGLHGTTHNTDYLEAYNQIWNHIAGHMSPSLTEVDVADGTLKPAFWSNTQMKHVKPTFDDALLEGEIPITFSAGGDLPVRSQTAPNSAQTGIRGPGATVDVTPPVEDGAYNWTGEVWAELEEGSVQMSLANIKLARETAAWARLRTQFQGLSEDWMMDQLLAGVRVRDENLRMPIELDMAETVIGMSERYATDGANLDQSVVDGRSTMTLQCGIPATACGGVFMVVAQALPEQLYERQRDAYAYASSVADVPNRTADELDPQPVDLCLNGEVDESHSTPNDLFGYRPLNAKWLKRHVSVGGKYYRPDPAAPWTEDRNRLWTPDVVDPQLGPDFYLSTTLSHNVFVTSTEDPFEWWCSGIAQVEGLTYFGPALREGLDDYDKVLEQVDAERLAGDGTDTSASGVSTASESTPEPSKKGGK
ncbi:major capsid protein [Microviridae sp.]|nr:major capsid protein [Microviridae sp.]